MFKKILLRLKNYYLVCHFAKFVNFSSQNSKEKLTKNLEDFFLVALHKKKFSYKNPSRIFEKIKVLSKFGTSSHQDSIFPEFIIKINQMNKKLGSFEHIPIFMIFLNICNIISKISSFSPYFYPKNFG